MGKHESGYQRIERDFYPTPTWVTNALTELVDVRGKHIWECACGDGRMSEPLKAAGAQVYSSDIIDRGYTALNLLHDFLSQHEDPLRPSFDGIITNPPYGKRGKLAERFIASGIQRMGDGFLALLLPADFDSARTRAELFGFCPQFVGKIVLTRRIKWFEHPGNPTVTPKENSSWFLWGSVELRHPQAHRVPILRYAPQLANHVGVGC